MAIMYPSNINEYLPTRSEKIVYDELKKQLPDSYEVFYSVEWSKDNNGKMEKSEADFIVTHPNYGYICLEVKGGSRLYIEDNQWYLEDIKNGTRRLKRSPYAQAEESMYYFKSLYRQVVNLSYNGIIAAGVVFPFFNVASIATEISDRQSECTIDATKMNDLHNAIKSMFKTCEEVACVIKLLLKDEKESVLGVFYDDVQKIQAESFGDAFMIETPPFLLRENIRNTSNIYNYAMENTDLGRDVIRNSVEGPNPMKEKISDKKHLTQRLGNLLKEFIIDESLNNSSVVILFEDIEDAKDYIENGLAQWKFVFSKPTKDNEIQISSAFDYKGLEADMIIYIHNASSNKNINYIAYTRAKYYLYELIK